ncbi:MAG: DUF1553 domain-containing protein, partial [Planctomycetaceae bacterium]|nr:DUF1553 domain-containing protein [Planctomycetaceae bacterium]
AEQLKALRAEAGPALLRAFAELVEPTVNDADKYLLAAQSVLEDGITLKKTAADLVFADFETGTYEDWTATGDAFGAIPQTQQTIASYQGNVKAHGTYFVNSHQKREGGRGDDAVGTLTSTPFVIEHPHINFLVGGGAHAGKTCVNLLVEGKVVRTTTGRNSNEMVSASWDVSDLRGQTARIQLVDEERGGWGNIGFDHVVFSDRAHGADQPRRITPADFAPRMQRQLVNAAQEYGVHVSTLGHWVAALASAGDKSDFLSQFNQPLPVAGQSPAVIQTVSTDTSAENSIQRQLEELLSRDDVQVIANYHASPELLTDGPVFATGYRRGGEALLSLTGPKPVESIADFGAVERDRFWDMLKLAPGTNGDPGGTENWQRAGRLLRTPTFEITQPKVFALVRGGVHTYACVDSHITIRGPLHGSLLRNHASREDWHWIEHDVQRYEGHRAHLEFVPQGDDDFAVAVVVQAASGFPALELGYSEFATSDPSRAPAQKLRILLEAAVHLMYGDQTVSADEPHIVRAANWLLSHPGLSGLDESNLKRWQQLAEPYAQRWRTLQSQVKATSSTAPAWMDGTPEDEYVFIRGNWKKRGEAAPRQFLEVFHGSDSETGRAANRLDLARQVVDPQRTPITARVIVNRIWLHYFGRGIVPTPDDFGHLGQSPSHPELLDWLAAELIEHDWSLKHVHRLILSSTAYRMSSRSADDAHVLEVDPNNVLLHRMNLKRLEGEIIRDAILSLSGRLDPTMYGPSIPIHLTPFLEGRGRPQSGPVDGAGRRSIYLSVRRNFPEPFFQAFDFPNPHTTIGRRSVSNVPSQALALMNNELVIEQARKWAGELLRNEPDDEARLNTLYRSALCRLPTAEESARAQQFLTAQATEYQTTTNDERIWADLCQVIWNTKEFVFVQ